MLLRRRGEDILDFRQQGALLALLRMAADGEMLAENLRCRLCEAPDFDPYETFKNLQGSWHTQKGWISASDLHRWLTSQPGGFGPGGLFLEDTAAVMAQLDGTQHGDLRYEGFLHMVLPRDPSNMWLRDTALARGSAHAGYRPGSFSGQVPAEVAYRLTLLLENEVDICRHLKFHRHHLQDLGVGRYAIQKFLDLDQGFRLPGGGLVSVNTLRRLLTIDGLAGTVLSNAQCDALLRKMNVAGAYTVSFDELAKVLMPGLAFTVPLPEPLSEIATRSLSPRRRAMEDSQLSRYQTPVRRPSIDAGVSQSFDRRTDVSKDWSPPGSPRHRASAMFSPYQGHSVLERSPSRYSSKIPDPRFPSLAGGASQYSSLSTTADYSKFQSPISPRSRYSSPVRTPFRDSGDDLMSSWAYSPRSSIKRARSVDGIRPIRYSLAAETQDMRLRATRTILEAVMVQADCDAQVEEAKAAMPPGTSLEGIFNMLDRFRKGYLTDTDLWQYTQDFGGTATYAGCVAAIHEVQLHRLPDRVSIPGRLNLRELGSLVLPAGSTEHEAVCAAVSDAEALSILYLLKHSEPCPRCGIRIQRDADSTGCPSVTCPVCRTSFRCFITMGDYSYYENGLAKLPIGVQYSLYRLLDVAAHAAEEVEHARKQISFLPGSDVLGHLSDAFSYIADGRRAFLMGDLRRALFSQDFLPSEQHLGLVWRRYAGPRQEGILSGIEVNFSDFLRQLKPRTSAW